MDADEWACGTCTLVNAQSVVECSVCNTPRGGAPASGALPDATPPSSLAVLRAAAAALACNCGSATCPRSAESLLAALLGLTSPASGGYSLKSIRLGNRSLRVLQQAGAGPCPLIAIANTLILGGKMLVRLEGRVLTNAAVVDFICAEVRHNIDGLRNKLAVIAAVTGVPQQLANAFALHKADMTARIAQFEAALTVVPGLVNGLDVNPRFEGCASFHAAPPSVSPSHVFAAVGISAFHTFVAAAGEEARAVGHLSYDDAADLETLLRDGVVPPGMSPADAAVLGSFMRRGRQQAEVTGAGLAAVAAELKECCVCVLYQGGHFHTVRVCGAMRAFCNRELRPHTHPLTRSLPRTTQVIRYQGRLYSLATAESFEGTGCMWLRYETAESALGTFTPCDESFEPLGVPAAAAAVPLPALPPPPPQLARRCSSSSSASAAPSPVPAAVSRTGSAGATATPGTLLRRRLAAAPLSAAARARLYYMLANGLSLDCLGCVLEVAEDAADVDARIAVFMEGYAPPPADGVSGSLADPLLSRYASEALRSLTGDAAGPRILSAGLP